MNSNNKIFKMNSETCGNCRKKLMIYNEDDLTLEDYSFDGIIINKKLSFVGVFVVFVLVCFSFFMGNKIGCESGKNEILRKLHTYEKGIIIVENDEFTEEKFIEMLKNLNVKFPHIVMAQAIIESDLGKSPLFITNNNLFGMKEAIVRPNHHDGSNRGHALYNNSWRQSVYDYLYWQLWTGGARISTEDEYYVFLQVSGYAEDENYVQALRATVQQRKLKELF